MTDPQFHELLQHIDSVSMIIGYNLLAAAPIVFAAICLHGITR